MGPRTGIRAGLQRTYSPPRPARRAYPYKELALSDQVPRFLRSPQGPDQLAPRTLALPSSCSLLLRMTTRAKLAEQHPDERSLPGGSRRRVQTLISQLQLPRLNQLTRLEVHARRTHRGTLTALFSPPVSRRAPVLRRDLQGDGETVSGRPCRVASIAMCRLDLRPQTLCSHAYSRARLLVARFELRAVTG